MLQNDLDEIYVNRPACPLDIYMSVVKVPAVDRDNDPLEECYSASSASGNWVGICCFKHVW